jgi:NAD(P)-dependent dehydrogenase (short-subunit alcohol dehydrogenase family)
LVVLGGGPIGSELAQSFARLGSQVTQVEMGSRIMAREDMEVSELAKKALEADGVDVRVGHKALRCEVRDGEKLLGRVLRSSRMAVAVRGFNGSSDVLVALDAGNSKVLGVALLDSRDNEPYLTDVKEELKYTDGFAGISLDEIAGTTDHADRLLVSGASTTAMAVFHTVQEMLRRYQWKQTRESIPWRVPVGLLWLSAGVWLGFRGGKKSRAAFACSSVAAGLVLGWMVGQDQLLGWGQHGWKTLPAMPLLVMTAIALIIPAFTGKNVYCSRICPHGAAQTLAGMAWKKRWALPARAHRIFSAVPWLSLLAIWALALAGSGWPFAHAEPFEVWSTGFVALLPAVIFTMSIVVSFFLPQGYCHYGCPTGALLKFLTHAPGRWTRRDSIAVCLVAVAWLVTLF